MLKIAVYFMDPRRFSRMSRMDSRLSVHASVHNEHTFLGIGSLISFFLKFCMKLGVHNFLEKGPKIGFLDFCAKLNP